MDKNSEAYGKLKSMYEAFKKQYPKASPEELQAMCKKRLLQTKKG